MLQYNLNTIFQGILSKILYKKKTNNKNFQNLLKIIKTTNIYKTFQGNFTCQEIWNLETIS